EPIALRRPERHEVAHLEREEQDRADADCDEDSDPEIDRGAPPFHVWDIPLNMKTVSTKSSARIASELSTTVRVVALDTPSAVGLASKPSNAAIKLTATPKTTLLMIPLRMSKRKSTAAFMLPQKAPTSMSISLTPTRYAPKMPIVENSAASSGIEI